MFDSAKFFAPIVTAGLPEDALVEVVPVVDDLLLPHAARMTATATAAAGAVANLGTAASAAIGFSSCVSRLPIVH